MDRDNLADFWLVTVDSEGLAHATYAVIRNSGSAPFHQGFHCTQKVKVCPIAFARYGVG